MGRAASVMGNLADDPVGQTYAASLMQGLHALDWHLTDIFTILHRDTILASAAQHRLPTVYFARSFTTAGGLMSYGIDYAELFLRSAAYIDRILKGASPRDLPVQQPTKFELVINLKTAKERGISLSTTLLATADEVIE